MYRGLVRATFERHAGLDDVLGRVAQLPARTVIFDVEPLVARWDSGQDALDLGVGLVIGRMAAIPGLRVVCFATNSRRRPSVLPPAGDVRVVYLTAARKPVRASPYTGSPSAAFRLMVLIPAIVSHQPLPWLILCSLLFVLATVPWLLAVASRKIALRADMAGITLVPARAARSRSRTGTVLR